LPLTWPYNNLVVDVILPDLMIAYFPAGVQQLAGQTYKKGKIPTAATNADTYAQLLNGSSLAGCVLPKWKEGD
jgi:hypothetical protein